MAALMMVGAGLAWAGDDGWGSVDCGQVSAAGCELSVGKMPRPAGGWGSSLRPVMRARVPDDERPVALGEGQALLARVDSTDKRKGTCS